MLHNKEAFGTASLDWTASRSGQQQSYSFIDVSGEFQAARIMLSGRTLAVNSEISWKSGPEGGDLPGTCPVIKL